MATFRCQTCKEVKERSPTNFRLRLSGGWYRTCKICYKKRRHEKRMLKHAARRAELGIGSGQAMCPRCRKVKDRTLDNFRLLRGLGWRLVCRSCFNADRREVYAKHPHKGKVAATVQRAVDRGLLVVPPACSRCGKDTLDIHGHHADYGKPLEVEWVCRSCHITLHNRSRGGAGVVRSVQMQQLSELWLQHPGWSGVLL